MRQGTGAGQEGFSLVELLVAMMVTLIVTGAIYGLLSSGHSAFRREPELADRQQNIRLAMDIITRDIENAGSSMPIWSQVFTINDAGGVPCGNLNGCGMVGALGNTPAAARGGDSANSDVLEVLGTDDRCTSQSVCNTAPLAGAAGTFITREPITACLNQLIAAPGGFVLLTDTANGFTIQPATTSGTTTACPAGGASPPNGNLTLAAAVAPWTWAGAPAPSAAAPIPGVAGPEIYLYSARVARYRIANNPDPADPAPALWRSTTGRFTTAGAAATEPGAAGFPSANSTWQMIARGIEDLQVEYRDGGGAWLNVPTGIVLNNYATIIRQVRVTLSARALAPQLTGQTSQAAGGAGGDAVRGQLISVVTPRAAVVALQLGNQIR